MFLVDLIRKPFGDLLHRPKGNIPALDALRAFAVLCVLASHLDKAYLQSGGLSNWFSNSKIARGGWMGVDLFFVLSGYFIGKQLWRELIKTGSINFKRFAIRRGLRIWPLYFFFLLFVGLVMRRAELPFGRWWSDALFITNYVNRGVVMGSWSLCIEEQFYILSPLVLIVGAFFCCSLSSHRRILVALLLLSPALRAFIWWHATGSFGGHDPEVWFMRIYSPIHTHSDGLVMGMLIANLQASNPTSHRKGFFTSWWAIPAAAVACLLLQKLNSIAFDFSGLTLVFGAAVWFLLFTRHKFLGILDNWIFYLLSRLSFGMYLNHEYLHERVAAVAVRFIPLGHVLPAAHEMLALLVLAAISAFISLITFCLVEYPFLQLRSRLLGVENHGHFETQSPALARGNSIDASAPPAESPDARYESQPVS